MVLLMRGQWQVVTQAACGPHLSDTCHQVRMAGTVTAQAIRLLDSQLQGLEEDALASKRQSSVSFLLRRYMCLVSHVAVFQCLL
jgi:hypothetical protein